MTVMPITLDLTPILRDMIVTYGFPVAAAFLLGFLAACLTLFYFYRHPEKLQKIFSRIAGICVKLGFKIQKTYIKLDIEGRVNDFIIGLQSLVYGYEPIGVKIKWAEPKEAEESFFNEDTLVLVIRDSGVQNKNFVRASMTVIAKTVFSKTRRYLSKTQAESVDLYIGKKLFEEEKPQVTDYFFEEYFGKKTSNHSNIADLVEKYNIMDKAGLFFPIFIQELSFLGEKVFYNKKTDEIIRDVNSLIDFLKQYALREIGTTTTPLVYQGRYCRCGIVIIGKIENVEAERVEVYVNYVKKLLDQKIENFYFISPKTKKNIDFANLVVSALSKCGVEEYRRYQYRALVNRRGTFVYINSHLIILRSGEIIRYYDTDYQRGYIENSEKAVLETE